MSATFSFPAALLLVLGLVFASNYNIVRGNPDETVVNVACSGVTFDSQDPYGVNVIYVVNAVLTNTPISASYEYYSTSLGTSSVAYGYADCYVNLPEGDCSSCLVVAFAGLIDYCPSNTGAQVELVDCKLRYENYPFQENVE